MNSLNDIAVFLQGKDKIAIISHETPDGDACGSSIALCLALLKQGKQAFVCLPDGISKKYLPLWNPDCGVIIAGDLAEMPFQPNAVIGLDYSELRRMRMFEDVFAACPCKATLDHHKTNEISDGIVHIDGGASSCGELVARLLDEMGIEMDADIATWIYTAIVTDCGQFGFSCTSPETLEIAANCMRAGADYVIIQRVSFNTSTEGHLNLLRMLLNGMQYNEEKSVCWFCLTQEMMQAANAEENDKEGLVNYLLRLASVQIACFAMEKQDGSIKMSLRSKEPFEVGENVCKPLGGGGHGPAAGIVIAGPMDVALNRVMEKINEALEKGKKELEKNGNNA